MGCNAMPYCQDLLHDDGLAVAVIDALPLEICVLDTNGVITAVNRAWRDFAQANGARHLARPVGINYLEVCRQAAGLAVDEAPSFAEGLQAVLRGERALFEMDYPCHSPTVLRWFMARVTPLRRRPKATGQTGRCGPLIGAVVSHLNITDRKRTEMDNARLAATDALTGLPNRRFLDLFAQVELGQFRRFGNALAVLMIDLDTFKGVNDVYGHAAGDEVLRHVAAIGAASFRGCDLFARLGGDEFTCLMPRADLAAAGLAAERFRSALERSPFGFASHAVSVTASLGVTVASLADRDMDDILRRADTALYRAKIEGRNRVYAIAPEASGAAPPPGGQDP